MDKAYFVDSVVELNCKKHQMPLRLNGGELSCEKGCSFQIINGIARFVPAANYASSFGLQWNTYKKTQLDSFTGISISGDRLMRIAGGSLEVFRGKKVLEAGCGAGRFSEVMLEAGADLFAVDISSAVEANYENCEKYPNYFVCQADILEIPVHPEQFDVVVCIGVIQHTPDPEKTIQALSSHVKPGGLLLIDHYTYGYPVTASRNTLREYLRNKNSLFALRFVKWLVNLLWPAHVILYKLRDLKIMAKIRQVFLDWSPVVDYQDAYPALGSHLLYTWAVLDTHDTLTDFYKHLRSAEEIQKALNLCGLTEIETTYAGNGVEARARKAIEGA